MARPGVEIVSRSAPPSRGAPSDTGVAFMAGLAEKGSTVEAILVRNMAEYAKAFGARVSYGLLHDALDVFFREGGTRAYVARVVGPAAIKDKVTLNDSGAVASIRVETIGEGGLPLTVQVVAGSVAGTFILVIADNAIEVERSPDLLDVPAAVGWGSTSGYIRVVALGVNDPAVIAAQALITGVDDQTGITDVQRIAALTRFTKALGPGQVLYPGATTAPLHAALLNHAKANSRVALLDGTDTAVTTTLTAQVAADRADGTITLEAVQRGALFAPWAVVPGVVPNTTRVLPPSALVAGLMARNDGRTGNPNDPAAGASGEARYALGTSQPAWTDAQRQTLNEGGVDVLRMIYGAVRLYGYRTVAPSGDPWLALNAARVRGAIEHQAEAIGEEFIFAQLDGRGRKIAEFGGALTGMLQGWWLLGALYGATPDEAFVVDVGITVNTPATLAANELRAVIGLRTSPFAELVYIEIVKIPVTETL